MFEKAVIISSDELIRRGTKVIIIGTVGDKKYTVRKNNGDSFTVMKESVEVL